MSSTNRKEPRGQFHALTGIPTGRKLAPASFAERLTLLFEAANPPMTKQFLAAAVDVTPPHIGYLLKGDRGCGLDTAADLELVLGAPVAYLSPYWPDDDDDALTRFHTGLTELAELRASGVLDLARQIAELSPADREKIEQDVATQLELVLEAPVANLSPYRPEDDALTRFHGGLTELAELRASGALEIARQVAELRPVDGDKIEQDVADARPARYWAG